MSRLQEEEVGTVVAEEATVHTAHLQAMPAQGREEGGRVMLMSQTEVVRMEQEPLSGCWLWVGVPYAL